MKIATQSFLHFDPGPKNSSTDALNPISKANCNAYHNPILFILKSTTRCGQSSTAWPQRVSSLFLVFPLSFCLPFYILLYFCLHLYLSLFPLINIMYIFSKWVILTCHLVFFIFMKASKYFLFCVCVKFVASKLLMQAAGSTQCKLYSLLFLLCYRAILKHALIYKAKPVFWQYTYMYTTTYLPIHL